MTLNEKHPYLTAWIGFVAIMAVGALILGFLQLSSVTINGLIRLFFLIGIGFLVFKALIKEHILENSHEIHLATAKGLSAKYPFLTAWLGFLGLSLIPTYAISFFASLIRNDVGSFIVELTLGTVVNFFVFKFVVSRHIA